MSSLSARNLIATLIVITGSAPAVAASLPSEAPPPVNKWARHYYNRVARFEAENRAARNVVLVGSSHIEGLDADKYLPGRRVVNRGIASDRIGITERGILHRLGASVFDCNPGCIILENGVNDLGELWRHGTPTIPEIDACYRQVVERIRAGCPDVPLIIVGLFPTRGRYADLKPMILEFNERLKKIAADHKCAFMDVFTPFADEEGLLRADLTRDGLHVNDEGYRIWAGLIETMLPKRFAATASQPAAGADVGGSGSTNRTP